MPAWSPASWSKYVYEQAVHYPDDVALQQIIATLNSRPPLVTFAEIKQLKRVIAMAGHGKAFILQGGDCAESFQDCQSQIISSKLKILLQMGLILLHGIRKPIIPIGRIAGQYTKPRTIAEETIGGITLPTYRGDLIHSPEFSQNARTPNPELLLQGYSCAAITLNFIRALLDGGFADLHHPHQWDLDFVKHSPRADEYQRMVKAISDSLDELADIDQFQHENLSSQQVFYTSHEALHLHYEQALTRRSEEGSWYDSSTHLPWVGMRTAHPNSAHIEFLRGIENPIGIKIGPKMSSAELKELLERLNPKKEHGKILLISRMGVNTIDERLPALIEQVKKLQIPVTWSCDPMHGNTEVTLDGIKTRHFDNIQKELLQALSIHRQYDTLLAGVHLELTGDNVTECIGGARGLAADDLKRAYHSLLDPRLNYEQSLEIAFQLSKHYRSA